MQRISFTKKNEKLPSSFDERVKILEHDGAERITNVPHKYEKDLICVVKNGESSESVYFNDRKEFNQFRNSLLRNPKDQKSVIWFHYSKD